jgi:poly(A) polymerase
MSLTPAQKIAIPDWMKHPGVNRIMNAIGQNQQAFFVGGCVRNTLMNLPVQDIDIATQLRPDDVISKLETADIKVIPTGLKHGTVTAVCEGQNFEITTLRRDVETDGRHADVAYTDDYIIDAKRRDFTVNTLLAGQQGNIYDPLRQGLEDLEKRQIKFVGDPSQRIEEDYLRILRFFRFHAYYGEGVPDKQALEACKQAAHHIHTLSRERITAEFLKIMAVDAPYQTLKIIFESNVLSDVLANINQADELDNFCSLQTQHAKNLSSFGSTEGSILNAEKDPAIKSQDDVSLSQILMPRLFLISGYKPKFYDDLFRLTHAQKNFLVKLEMAFNPIWYQDARSLKKAIYHHGRDLMLQGYMLLLAAGKLDQDKALLDIIQHWPIPECPITGEQLMAEGYVTGPDLGQELERRKEEWLESVV